MKNGSSEKQLDKIAQMWGEEEVEELLIGYQKPQILCKNKSNKSFCEVYYLLVGNGGKVVRKIDNRTNNNPAEVKFDYQAVYEREDKHKDVVGFLHTHPYGYKEPSATDVATMKAWTSCLGKPLICIIDCTSRTLCYTFSKDGACSEPTECKKMGNLIRVHS